MHRTERSVPWQFNTNTCTVPPLIYIYIYIHIYTDQNDKCNTFVFFPHFSWAELKDVRLFLCTQKAYFSQILFTNLSKSVLVSTSCRDNPSTSQVWHIKMLIRQNDYCTGGLGLQTWGKLSWNWTENELIPKVLFKPADGSILTLTHGPLSRNILYFI